MRQLRLLIALLLLPLSLGCGFRHAFHITTDAEVLDKLGYVGPNRAVNRVGDQKCYTNDDTQPFPQKDLRCY